MPTDIKKLVARIGSEEKDLAGRLFIAPVVEGGKVCVKVSGLVYRLTVEPAGTRGWGIFRIAAPGRAAVVRDADLGEIARYLEALPVFRLMLVERTDRGWLGTRATADHRLQPDVLYPVGLVDGGQIFDICLARFDGASFWFESVDAGSDPVRADYMRTALGRGDPVEMLQRKGLSELDRRVYEHALEIDGGSARDRRIRRALAHAGARLEGVSGDGPELTVSYNLRGQRHEARVRASDLTLLSAGVCLSGRDADFDLSSLMSVMRQAVEEEGY